MIKKILLFSLFLIIPEVFAQPLYNQWIWVDGSKNANEKIADFGLVGLEDINNWPYKRKRASGITDNNGNLILFGGWFEGQGASNEIWSYNPLSNIWKYKKGILYKYFPGNNYTQGVGIEHRKNNPIIRSNSQVWKDNNGNLWTFGGSSNSLAIANDMWKFNFQTNNWTQITQGEENSVGNFGTLGVESTQNIPPILSYGTTWTDLNGNLWMFGGQDSNSNSYSEAGLDSYNSLWKFNITTGNWTWVAGSSTINQSGSYGILGVESPLNYPGARANAASWVDSQGYLWLFGGFSINATNGEYNDIWKFNPNTGLWTWVKGSANSSENITTINSEHPNNMPKGVNSSKPIFWKDNADNFWYFDGTTDNRLWMFNPATKNWVLKKQINSWLPSYGNLGVSNITNTPGKRVGATTWTSTSGDFYLYSGSVYPSDNGYNDLWKYSINDNSWTWVKGFPNSSEPSQSSPSFQSVKLIGEYDEAINPGYFEDYTASWNDSAGNLWVFGITGEGYDGDNNVKDHLWKYNSAEKKWQWISGLFDWPRYSDYYNTYGTLGVENYKNNPLSRFGAMSWIDSSDNLWLFGGSKNYSYNDLWKYNKITNKWVWVNGSDQPNQFGIYGTQGQSAPSNMPGSRIKGASWTDNNGNFWLFGGSGSSLSSYGKLNDLWKYDISTNQWTWIKGSTSVNQTEISAGIGIVDPNNTPEASDNLLSWKDNSGNFWLYTNANLWKFSNNNWVKVKQNTALNYGTIGVYHDNNSPSYRTKSSTWVDPDGSLVLFGGESTENYQDLWKYNISLNKWVWIGGKKHTNFGNDAKANFGQINESFISNIPGGRKKTITWKDNNGNIYLYGGNGWDESLEGSLSDIWKTNRNFNTFSGNIKFNSNNNNCLNSTINVPNVKAVFSSNSDNKFTFSNASGNFSEISESNSVTITPSLNYFTFFPSSQTLNINNYGNMQNVNFCATATGVHNDLEIVIIPLTDAVPGFNSTYKIVYQNKGTTTLSGSLTMNYNSSLVTYLSSNIPPLSQNSGLITWNYSNLAPFTSNSITVTLKLNTPTDTNPVNSGDVLHFTTSVYPLVTDETPQNNTFNLNQTVVNALDPNDKTCLEGEVVGTNYINEYVNYVIRFENTGTAKATHVVIDDFIDSSKFDLSSILPVHASHDYKMIVSNTNKVSFVFEYIDLAFPPSTLRYGYIAFKIKTKTTLTAGDTFVNKANIYFDYNSPIITNEYSTIINGLLSTSDIDNPKNTSVYPNPTKDFLNIKSDTTVAKIELFDSMGRILQSLNQPGNQINLQSLPNGVYIIKIHDSNGIHSKKIIKK